MRLKFLLLALTAFLVAALPCLATDQSEFQYNVSADQVILKYTSISINPHLGDPPFGVVVYGDGRAIATIPEGIADKAVEYLGYSVERRGLFETRLTAQEVEEILRAVEPVFLIDMKRMKRQRKEQHPNRAITDGGFTNLAVNLTNYRPLAGSWQGPVAQAVEWKGIWGDARLYPGVPGIQALYAATKAMPAWIYRIAERVEAEELGK